MDNSSNQNHWIPLSDLMTGLMMVFMLISATYMLRVEQTTTLIVKEYEVTKKDLAMALQEEFSKDLKQWNAEFLGDMTLRFKNPDVLFSTGSYKLKPKFQTILLDFIPRYVKILTNKKFKNSIKEVRIEGYTSTFWTSTTSKQDAYFKNMELSQARTRSVLEFIIKIPDIKSNEEYLIDKLTANGLSSSHPILNKNNTIEEQASQRVEFRIVTNADEKLEAIAKGLK